MTINAYDTHTLLDVVSNLTSPSAFWLNLAFPKVQTFDTEHIDFDEVDKGRRLAPFVAPNVRGKPMTEQGFATRRFKPAYIKPKIVLQPDRPLKRLAGEPYTGALSPEARRNAIIADILQEQRDMIERRWEWMAAKAVQDGAVTVSGENYPSVTIAFGRAAGQTVTLAGNDLWTDTVNSDPIAKLEEVGLQTKRLSTSFVSNLVFGVDAWAAFINHPKVQAKLETRRGSTLVIESATSIGFSNDVAQYKGTMPEGGPRLWIYNDIYEDDDGNTVDFMDSRDVVGVGNVEGIRAFGAILDGRAGYQPLPMFPKMWEEQDPTVETIMMQSAPLMIPRRPNASFRMRVRT